MGGRDSAALVDDDAGDVGVLQAHHARAGHQSVPQPDGPEDRQADIGGEHLQQLSLEDRLVVLPQDHQGAQDEGQDRPQREPGGPVRQVDRVVALEDVGAPEAEVAHGDPQPHDEPAQSGDVEQPGVGGVLAHHGGEEACGAHQRRRPQGTHRHPVPVDVGEPGRRLALQGHRVQHAGRGVQARVPGTEHGGEDDRVHDGGRDPDPGPLEDQGEGRVGDVRGLRAQQVGVGVGNQEADHRDRPDVEDHDPPEHRVDRLGHITARVAGLTGRHAHQLGALEGEPGHHEHRHDRQHPAVEGRVPSGPVAEARGSAADDAGNHRHARDQEDDDRDHLDGRQPELPLAEGPGGQGVERRQQCQEQCRPDPRGHPRQPVGHDDPRRHQLSSHRDE